MPRGIYDRSKAKPRTYKQKPADWLLTIDNHILITTDDGSWHITDSPISPEDRSRIVEAMKTAIGNAKMVKKVA